MVQQRSWESYQSFALHGGLDRFTKIFARYELFKKAIDIPGDIVEGGVYRGAGVLYWAKLIQIFNPLSIRRVIGFDTFEGFPKTAKLDYDRETGAMLTQQDSYFKEVSPDGIMQIAASLDLDHRIELVKGDARNTIKDYVRGNPGFRIALLNLDFDTGDATAAALEQLYSLVVPRGVIVFDEYAIRGWGESEAVDKFFEDKHVVYESLSWTLTPTAYILKEA